MAIVLTPLLLLVTAVFPAGGTFVWYYKVSVLGTQRSPIIKTTNALGFAGVFAAYAPQTPVWIQEPQVDAQAVSANFVNAM